MHLRHYCREWYEHVVREIVRTEPRYLRTEASYAANRATVHQHLSRYNRSLAESWLAFQMAGDALASCAREAAEEAR
jgi:hypothetical protein